jgi:two-component system sensor histidine kinase/response regulator
MKILIAEDDPAFRQLLEEILVKWGYEVAATRDGNEAWQALKAVDAPRLVILDWMMPGMDGLEICRKVRKERPEPYTYIIMLTSQQRDEDLVTGMEAGADDYLAKPLKTNELKVRLNAGRRLIELQNELAAHASDLEAANKDLEAFSYAVANDLLKSLLSIGEYARSIQDIYCSKMDEQCRTYTHQIYEKTKKLGHLIGIMNDFFRPNRVELHPETIDLSKMAAKTAEKLRMTKPERRVKFRIIDGIMANGDRNLLQMVLDNLFDNAWKHTVKREEAFIEFGFTEVEGKVAYFVRDNGTGFDMAYADKLFKPFQSLPGTEEFRVEGIGLATVERIIRRHGGRVWAEGEPGKGATFYFSI